MGGQGIQYFEDYDEALKALNAHFKTVSIEKHPDAMIRFLIERSFKKHLKNYHKAKISQKVESQCRDYAIKEMRRYYGEWVNLYDFDLKRGKFRTNFESIYKTEYGRLYGNNPGSVHDHVFYTSHCFEQYQDRGKCYETYPLLVLAYKRMRNTQPTPADILRFQALNAFEYCNTSGFMYVNVNNGVLVYEKLSGGILIAKTFLLPDMEFPKKGWFQTVAGLLLDTTDLTQKACKLFPKFQIEKPVFPSVDLEYECYKKAMSGPLLSLGLDI